MGNAERAKPYHRDSDDRAGLYRASEVALPFVAGNSRGDSADCVARAQVLFGLAPSPSSDKDGARKTNPKPERDNGGIQIKHSENVPLHLPECFRSCERWLVHRNHS
jgi:hypothetical protein